MIVDYSYSQEEVDEAVRELDEKLMMSAESIEEELVELLEYSMRIEDAKQSLLKKHPHSHGGVEYERFDSLDGIQPPPKVNPDDWIEYDDTTGRLELGKIGRDLQSRAACVVYCVECEVIGETLRAAQARAKERLNELPGWIKDAYLADHVFYVGQSARLGKRLEQHAIGRMRESPPPAQLTRISHTTAVGVIRRIHDRGPAKSIEQAYAENFQEITDDSIFVYHS